MLLDAKYNYVNNVTFGLSKPNEFCDAIGTVDCPEIRLQSCFKLRV